MLILDAAGLAFFAVSGALKALSYGLMPFAAIMLGVLTGVGGGIARDVLVAEIPSVLRAELYAVAALAGRLCCGRLANMLQLPISSSRGGGRRRVLWTSVHGDSPWLASTPRLSD